MALSFIGDLLLLCDDAKAPLIGQCFLNQKNRKSNKTTYFSSFLLKDICVASKKKMVFQFLGFLMGGLGSRKKNVLGLGGFGTLRFSLLSAVCFFVHGYRDIIVVIEHTMDMVKIEWIVIGKERCPR